MENLVLNFNKNSFLNSDVTSQKDRSKRKFPFSKSSFAFALNEILSKRKFIPLSKAQSHKNSVFQIPIFVPPKMPPCVECNSLFRLPFLSTLERDREKLKKKKEGKRPVMIKKLIRNESSHGLTGIEIKGQAV